MPSFASYLPISPGISPSQQYSNNTINLNSGNHDLVGHKPQQQQQQPQQQQRLSQENMRLKASLTRVQNDYEELRDESNYQRAKVSELSDLVSQKEQEQHEAAAAAIAASSFKKNQEQYSVGESTVHNRLINTSLENAELNSTIDQLRQHVRQTEEKVHDLQRQKRENCKLLLEMSDVVRALNSVHIEYDTTSLSAANNNNNNNNSSSTAQLTSIKRIKLKVEAIMEDRTILVVRCKELDDEVYQQQQHIKALEAQFHIANTANLSTSVALADAASHCSNTNEDSGSVHSPHSPSYSSSYSTIFNVVTPSGMHSPHENDEEEIMTNKNSNNTSLVSSGQQRTPTVEYVRQSKELAWYKYKDEEQMQELQELQLVQKQQNEEIVQLRMEKTRTGTKLQTLQEELTESHQQRNDAMDNCDTYKVNLSDIVTHYKELSSIHTATQNAFESLQIYVEKLEMELQETKENQEHEIATQEDKGEDKKMMRHDAEEKKDHEEQHTKEEENHNDNDDDDMEALVVAYDRAMRKIARLELNLEWALSQQKDNGIPMMAAAPSFGSIEEVFDPPKKLLEKPFLAAALKAKEKQANTKETKTEVEIDTSMNIVDLDSSSFSNKSEVSTTSVSEMISKLNLNSKSRSNNEALPIRALSPWAKYCKNANSIGGCKKIIERLLCLYVAFTTVRIVNLQICAEIIKTFVQYHRITNYTSLLLETVRNKAF